MASLFPMRRVRTWASIQVPGRLRYGESKSVPLRHVIIVVRGSKNATKRGLVNSVGKITSIASTKMSHRPSMPGLSVGRL